MKTILILLLTFNFTIYTSAQQVESEFPQLIFNGTLLSVTPTGKAHQSYIFNMQIDSIIQGNYTEDEISFECYAGFHGNDLLEYFNCRTENADFPGPCSGSGRVIIVERNFHGDILYLFQSISPFED